MTSVWDPITIGEMKLPHRFVMARMTPSRARPDGVPGDLARLYYSQRSSMGLLISEGTQPSDNGQGYMTIPGIYTDAHVAGWKKITSAVHEGGGRFFIQLMHVGRISHPDNNSHRRRAVAPLAVAPGTKMFTATAMQEIPTPRALTTSEVEATVQDFRLATAARLD